MRSFVFVCDRPHLHLLLNEHFALRGIFLSADLGALSFWGESLLGGEKVEPTLLQEQPGQQHQPQHPATPAAAGRTQMPGSRLPGWDSCLLPEHRLQCGHGQSNALCLLVWLWEIPM